jgi:type II secretory pathway pseudopilin PulG
MSLNLRWRERSRAAGTARTAGGFTLIEILIALVILMVGLIGILAVFPNAIQSANKTVEDTYAASIAQSVFDAIQMGLRETPIRDTTGKTVGFIFYHDGVEVELEADRASGFLDGALQPGQDAQLNPKKYAIFFPRTTETAGFIFPRENPAIDNPGRRQIRMTRATVQGRSVNKVEVKAVYTLGTKMKSAPNRNESDLRDPYPQYSYAFTLEPATAPNPAGGAPVVVDGLFRLVIRVYRNFDSNPNGRRYDPVREFVTNLAI